jgi:hypothetical protein
MAELSRREWILPKLETWSWPFTLSCNLITRYRFLKEILGRLRRVLLAMGYDTQVQSQGIVAFIWDTREVDVRGPPFFGTPVE